MEELSDIAMCLLGLGGRRDFTRTDGPHGLVCNHDLAPVGFLGDPDDFLELSFDNLRALARLTLLQGFPDAKNHRQSRIDRSPGLLRHKFGGLAEESAALGMTEDNVWDFSISELSGTYLACECPRGLDVSVLRRDLEIFAQNVGKRKNVQRRGCDDDLSCRVDISIVEDLDDVLFFVPWS